MIKANFIITNLDRGKYLAIGETMPQSKYIENFKLKNFMNFYYKIKYRWKDYL